MDREIENVKLSPDIAPIHQLTAKVFAIDTIYMQEEWVPRNCEFCIDDLDQPDWYYPFRDSDFIHVGGLGGDRQLLTCILQGAYRYGLTPRIAHANTVSGAAHRMACWKYGTATHGFTDVAEHVYRIPLNTERPMTQKSVVVGWADGFEAYSMDLLVKHLGKRHLEVFLICAAARQALRKGVEGWLEM
ncbi:hypothetical protein BDQ94DRAFT_178234 [Aspergillus welwitschiae]|uniref:Uncharacterized protein n=1 Tax=Aspergillus welwitschiae TaxID=1341132 RepID=A0A3F3PHD3_9EURO|nr:hypothetical protein BDQ94DRAFT_178234 [Aspergillus welwitschiae]RDH26351.1 hypothetical protein BDQ94DRAFT_178234 [Aspergillus welwitschiae]